MGRLIGSVGCPRQPRARIVRGIDRVRSDDQGWRNGAHGAARLDSGALGARRCEVRGPRHPVAPRGAAGDSLRGPCRSLEKDLKNEGSCLGYDPLQTPVAIVNLLKKKK